MNTYLVYLNEADALHDEEIIYKNAISKAAADDSYLDLDGHRIQRDEAQIDLSLFDTKDKLFNVETKEWFDVNQLSDAELSDRYQFPLLGYRGKILNTNSGFTTQWDVPKIIDKGRHKGSWAMIYPPANSIFSIEKSMLNYEFVVDANYDELFAE